MQAGQSLSTYDPIADTSAEGLAARKAVATVATILASAANTATDAATADAVVSSVATNIATQLVTAASQATPSKVTFDATTVTEVLKDSSGAAVGDATVVQNVTTSVQTIETAVSVDVIVETQAKATDTIAPDAPDATLKEASDTGDSASDGITNDATPTITVSFETDATDGTAVVVGNLIEVLVGGNVVGSAIVTGDDLDTGSVDIDVGTFAEGDTSVVARVTDKAGNVSELASAITVSVDTQGPLITSDGFASVDENDGSDIEVYTAAATDANTFEYSLADGASADLSIDSQTGVVTLAGADFESQESYVFTVVATDIAGNMSERAVTLSINNVDEVAPTITSGATAQAIDENSGAGQVIYTALADDTADISGGVMFSLADGSDAGLSIDAQTGAVTLTGDPDHEMQSSYGFTVVAKDAAGNETTKDVTLAINDLDEVAPTITSSDTAVALDENSPADSVVYTATSTDDGDISTGATTYSLGAGSDQAITINDQTGEVTLTGVADFEQQDSYSFVVEAMDAAGNKSMKTVTLEINNLDEVAPVITSGDQITAIDENTASGQVIYTATATDLGDVSDGVTFSLAEGANAALSIDAETGVVTLNESPDFETTSSYEFTVVATDGAGNKVDKTLTLVINDLDEGPPVFTSATTASVDENVAAGSAVYTAAATDGSPITFSLAEEDASNFTIDAQTGVVSIVGSPNFEDQSEYTFTVTATDSADNADSQTVTLSVNNLDEEAPAITSGATAAAIDENSGADQVVYTATATDDADISGGVMFSLAEGSDAALSINAETGAVTLSTNPDHETQSSYQFTVIAKDAAGNMSEQAVSLTINDLDEANPIITSDSLVEIDENGPASAVIYTATATDAGDVSDGVTFSLGDGSSSAFTIDATSGEVTFSGPANYEETVSYVFTVVATDGAGNKDERAVTVLVNNLDEVAPVITSGATAEAITENTASGAVVYTATATDDGDVSEGVVFSLSEGSDAALSINAQTGEVTLNEIPDFETQESYSFTVVATDGAGNTDEQAVTLAVTNVDESAPTFTSPASGAALTATAFLYQAQASDDGDAVSGGVTYSLAQGGDADLLQIDPTDGVVTLKNGLLDPTVQDAYTFTVVADDGVNDPVTQSVTLTVPEANVVQGSGVVQQGGITIVDTDNGDGTYTLEFFVSDEFASDFPDGVGNYDFVFNYDATQFEAIAATDYTTEFALPTVNDEVAGRLVVGAIDLNALDLASGTPLGQLVVTPTSDADVTVSITDLIVNESDLPSTVVVYGDPVMVSGTEAPESFVLAGGEAEITGGAGVDVYVVTDSAGEQMSVTDYTADDVIDFSYALVQAGYNSAIDDTVPSVSAGQASELVGGSLDDVAGIMANEAAYDNTYGAIVDVDAGQILGYYDANPAAGVVDTVGFRLTIGEAAGALDGLNIAAIVNTGAAFTSGATGGAVTENDPTDQLVYTAAVELEAGQSVTFSLAAGVEELFSIDAQTGAVTFIGTADYETASTLGFTVVATDNEGNASRQSVSIAVVNEDDTAPTWVSGTSFTALAGTPFLYQAEADDSADVTLEPVQYSLDPNSADADLLAIDSLSGIVSLQQGVLVPEGKQAFTFTVVATDGVNDPVSQQVVATLGATTAVQGTGVLAQGGIQVVDVDNGDGTYTLEFYVDSSVAAQFANGVENYDFVFNYAPDQFEAIVAGDYTTSFSLPTVNDEVAGKLVVGAIDLTALDLADGTPLGSLTVTPLVTDGAEVSVTDVIVNTTDLASTQIIYGEPAIVSGTADNDTFTLLGGDTEITGGDGIDAYIVTETTGNQIYITDFMTDEDVIDMSSLLMGLGYTSISDLDLGPAFNGEAREYSQTSMDLLELVQANDFSFDNSFGMLIDTTNGKIVGFYDANSDADVVDMQTFEITIGESVADISLDNLIAGIGGFIA